VVAIYDFGIAAAVLPAVVAASKGFKDSVYRSLFKACFTANVIAAVIQVSSNNNKLLYIDGWVMGLAFLALWTMLLLNRQTIVSKS
jgi:hypothetical protein